MALDDILFSCGCGWHVKPANINISTAFAMATQHSDAEGHTIEITGIIKPDPDRLKTIKLQRASAKIERAKQLAPAPPLRKVNPLRRESGPVEIISPSGRIITEAKSRPNLQNIKPPEAVQAPVSGPSNTVTITSSDLASRLAKLLKQ